ncbi:MAG: ABC transporter ATP-binding protein [Clostridia bacterium]|nr:ABC transporter ATP-binding protein [Clostridia bacterium]MBR4033000.1 ABC transporter ATP-binding protein [Clostridia bacterium]
MNVLECKNLKKAYKKGNFVLNNFNICIPEGKIIGLLGPNGCGKSTLIKLIAGLLQPNEGEITVCGIPVGEQTKAMISYLPERPYFNGSMSVNELIEYFKEFYADFDEERAYGLLSDLGIDPKAKLKTLSKGTKEKVQLVLVMSRKARLYLLDEPIAGVDPAAREYILSTIVNNYDSEATIIITTHLITDVEQVLDDFVFLAYGGRIVASGSAEETRINTGKSLDQLFREVFRNA